MTTLMSSSEYERVIQMAHNIESFADGSSAFFSAREVAWHKLGTVTENALTAQDALKTAQLDSLVKVSEEPIFTTVDGTKIELDKKFLTYRNHPKKGLTALGVVGNRYTPIQNSEAFDFLNVLADESGAVFETAGSLGNGERVFMTMKFPDTMTLGGVDLIDNYIMAVNSHDGSSAFTVAVTPIRAVCTNTVRLALNSAKAKISLKHTSGATQKVQQARETLGIVWKYQEAFQNEVELMLSQKFTDNDYKKFIEVIIPEPKGKEVTERQKNSVERTRAELMGLWNAPTQQIVANTRWAAYNAVVEYADWVKPVRGGDDKDALRAEKIILGNGEKIKEKAQLLLAK
jgi:phage/plasmid-like protein (TIGR03299 family)